MRRLAVRSRGHATEPACLFGTPGLGQPADCLRMADHAAQHCQLLIGHILQQAETPSVSVLHGIDALSETLCCTLDTMELARNVHPNPAFIDAADSAYNQLAGCMHELSTDSRLYRAVLRVLDAPGVRSTLNGEQLRFATAMVAEFEGDGAHLSESVREKLRHLQADVLHAEARFAACTTSAPANPGGVWAPLTALNELPVRLLSALPTRDGQVSLHANMQYTNNGAKAPRALCLCRRLKRCCHDRPMSLPVRCCSLPTGRSSRRR